MFWLKLRLRLRLILVEVQVQETNTLLFQGWVGGWVGGVEEWRIKLTSAKVDVEVEVEVELGKLQSNLTVQSKSVGQGIDFVFPSSKSTRRKCNTDIGFGI